MPRYEPPAASAPETLDAFHTARLARSRAEGARPETEERWVRRGGDAVLLVVHGFVASRADGEHVIDGVAEALGADVYYVRLPGHGTTPDDLGRRRYGEWIDEAVHSLRAVARAYDRVAVVGTGLGAALGAYAASVAPDEVDALVLLSPLYGFRRRMEHLIGWPGGLALASWVAGGPTRSVPLDPDDPEEHRLPGFERFWYTRYPLSAVRELDRARRVLGRAEVLAGVRAPTLLLCAPNDGVADVGAMVAAVERFGTPAADRRVVAIARGDHVLASRWVNVHHGPVAYEMQTFLGRTLGLPRAPTS